MNDWPDPNVWLRETSNPLAVYFADADCVEYVAEDTVCVYDRIDHFLTLIRDETQMFPIGFKLKGFRNWFERIKDDLGYDEGHFVELVKVLETVCSSIGDESFGDDVQRRQAYKAAAKLARDKDVKLYDLPKVA